MEEPIQLTPPEIRALAQTAVENLLPPKSRDRYETCYKNFNRWKEENSISMNSLSENVLLAYFQYLSESLQPSSLWTRYSMLKSTINVNDNINISTYSKLIAFIKRQSDGFKSKKSKTLSSGNIQKFLNEAPDDDFLAIKVSYVQYT